MSDGSVPIVVSPVPFHSKERRDMAVAEGTTVRALLRQIVSDGILPEGDLQRVLPRTTVMINGEALDRASALDRRLERSDIVNIEVAELGGGGGGGGKDAGQILLSIAVIVVSAWVGGPAGIAAGLGTLGRAVASAAVLAAGNALSAALFAPETSSAKVNDRYALQAASNQYRPWSPFPLALGEVVVGPDLAAKTYTQAIGDDVWIHGILALHDGPCEASELKIGDTLVSSMGAGDWRAVEHLTPGPRAFAIYPNDVDQLDLSAELEATTSTATPVVRAAPSDGQRFELDFFLPAGLYFQKDDGRLKNVDLTITIRHREIDEGGDPVGAGTWTTVTRALRSNTKEPMRVTQVIDLPIGLYEFEVKRSLSPDVNPKRQDRVAWTALRAIAFRKPVVDETLSLIEFAVRASALNQGTLAPITCRIIPKVPTWNGTVWTAPVASSNPAALVRWLLTGPAAARPLSAGQADVRLRAWATLCDDYDWTCNIYLTEARTQAEALGLVADSGRGSLFWDGTQMVASAWVEKPAPRQLFAGDNLKDHRWKILYPEPVHALRVEFQNIDEGGDPDEVYVYADGYGELADVGAGIVAASLVEALRLEGQKTAERAYRDGRWELGRRLHQRRVDTWTTSVEHLVSGYGDRVRLAWQRLDEGVAVRVRTRRWAGGLVTGLRLNEPVEMRAGESYAADLRLIDGVVTAVPIINPAVSAPVVTREINFVTARSEATSPRAGDKLAFGISSRVSEDVELIGIEPGEGLTASLTGIRYVAPLLIEGETAPIPPLQTRLSRHRSANPPTPVLLGVQADPAGVRVSFAIPPWAGSPIVGFPARWRPTPAEDGDTGWLSLPTVSSTAGVLVTPPVRALPSAIGDDEGATLIDIEIRAVTAAGQISTAALTVSAIEVREDPFAPENVTVTPATRTAADGSSHGVLIVQADALAAAVGIDLIVEVRLYDGVVAQGWESSGLSLTSTNPLGDILGLRAAATYGVRTAWRSAGGWPSAWSDEITATVPAGSNVSGDVSTTSPTVIRSNDQLLDEAVVRFGGFISETIRRQNLDRETFDRFSVLGEVDPVSRSTVLRGDAIQASGGGIFLDDAIDRTAAGLTAAGVLQTAIPSALADSSNILRRTAGGLYTGSLTATAGATWGTDVASRPVELTDGRITTGLNAAGVLQTAIPSALADSSNILRRTAGGLYTGSLTATAGATWGTDVASRPVELTDGRITTGLSAAGVLQTAIPLGVADASNIMRRTAGGLYIGSLAATAGATWGVDVDSRPVELTDGRIATALNSSGVLQTAMPSGLADTSNLFRRAGGGIFTGATNANYTTNTNELADGANLGGTAAWSGVSSRPVELTDGRITTGLNSSGVLLTAIPSVLADASNILRRTGGGSFTGSLTATEGAQAGINLFKNDGITALSETEIIGRYMGQYSGDAAANSAGMNNGDCYVDTSITPNAFKVKSGGTIAEVDTSGLFKQSESSVVVNSSTMSDKVTRTITNTQENSFMSVWMTIVPTIPEVPYGGSTPPLAHPYGTWEITEDATGGSSPRVLLAGTWTAIRDALGGPEEDNVQSIRVNSIEGDASDISRVWLVRGGGSRTWKLRFSKDASSTNVAGLTLSLLVQIQRNPA